MGRGHQASGCMKGMKGSVRVGVLINNICDYGIGEGGGKQERG